MLPIIVIVAGIACSFLVKSERKSICALLITGGVFILAAMLIGLAFGMEKPRIVSALLLGDAGFWGDTFNLVQFVGIGYVCLIGAAATTVRLMLAK